MHGLGLSVDIHAPDLISLRRSLQERQVPPTYLECSVRHHGLGSARKEAGDGLLTYHGEGLWVTQPEMVDSTALVQEISETADHLLILQSAWLNHECATKYLAGYHYGTYLPPLYTPLCAKVVADNTRLIQHLLDQQCRLANGSTPLVLLEMPPLTYFVAGTMSIPRFFRASANKLPVGWFWTWAIFGQCFDIPERIWTCRLHDLSRNFSTSFPWIEWLRFTWRVWPFMNHTESSIHN